MGPGAYPAPGAARAVGRHASRHRRRRGRSSRCSTATRSGCRTSCRARWRSSTGARGRPRVRRLRAHRRGRPGHRALPLRRNGMVRPAAACSADSSSATTRATTMITMPTELARSVPETPDWAWCRDWWVATQVARTHELDCVAEPITRYRLHGANMSASDEGQPEKTLRLFHRDLHVRRIFMRSFDLAETSLDELLAAWRRHVHYIGVLVHHRGGAPGDVLPVSDADRAEAARRSRRRAPRSARTRSQPGRPHSGRSAPTRSRRRPGAARARARGGRDGARRAPLRSASQTDRLRELDERRAAVVSRVGAARPASRLPSPRDPAAHARQDSGTPPPTSRAPRPSSATAPRRRRDRRARRRARPPRARPFSPSPPPSPHARRRARPPRARRRVRRARRPGPRARGRRRARARCAPPRSASSTAPGAFVGLAWADELAADPALLAAWADAFGADDDATLVIYAPGSDEGAVVGRVGSGPRGGGHRRRRRARPCARHRRRHARARGRPRPRRLRAAVPPRPERSVRAAHRARRAGRATRRGRGGG